MKKKATAKSKTDPGDKAGADSETDLTQLTQTLLAAIASSGKTHYRIARDAGWSPGQSGSGVTPAMISTFVDGSRRGISVETAGKIAAALGLELVESKKGRKKEAGE